jgi:hypothetical protein
VGPPTRVWPPGGGRQRAPIYVATHIKAAGTAGRGGSPKPNPTFVPLDGKLSPGGEASTRPVEVQSSMNSSELALSRVEKHC